MADIQYLKGVGPKKAFLFAGLDIATVSDLLHYYPRAYQDRRPDAPLSEFKKTENVCILASVIDARLIPARSLSVFKAMLRGGDGVFYEAVWFKRRSARYDALAALKKDFRPGARLWVVGRREDKNSFASPRINVEEYYPADSPSAKIHTNGLIPLYGLTQGLANRFFRECVAAAVEKYLDEEPEILPPALLAKRRLLNAKQALRGIHFPASAAELEAARRRMVYEEFLLMTMAWQLKQKQGKAAAKEHNYLIKRALLTPFKNNLGFNFTAAQTRVINEIFADLQKTKPMTRLLQGDVGSGKTVVALCAMLLAAENGFQSAFMAPTEILAAQHFITMRRYLGGLDVKVEMLTSKTAPAQKAKILAALAEGKIDIVVGTHSLIEDNVIFKNLRLIVIDEQHRFGVKQRAKLRAKARHIDMLSMTATPIPRTFALAFYGDLDVSTIDELPPGRKPVRTIRTEEAAALELVRAQAAKGRQAYIVYPLIDESDKLALKAVAAEFERLQKLMPQLKIAMLHGGMKAAEKQKIMEDFAAGRTDVLAATPVIEVGIDVKNATVMVVQNAERFGMASLHQLRGRVGRGAEESFCALVAPRCSAHADERLRAVCVTNDGFKIGEKDLEIRGPGEILGTRQSGDLEFKTGDIIKDKEVLRWAVEDRAFLMNDDPQLLKPENRLFKLRLIELYQKQWHLIDLG
ncbi:MAG: ATP-dependent DNA helicase RecG [Elusimicrobiota bacterium]|jgi:ATP-dependent DNA helicase RecG|nr:ATP-dependent DNA helicase RecG [Elusimicrobiota bacterium]